MYIKKRSEMTVDVNGLLACHIDTAEITDLASGLHNINGAGVIYKQKRRISLFYY